MLCQNKTNKRYADKIFQCCHFLCFYATKTKEKRIYGRHNHNCIYDYISEKVSVTTVAKSMANKKQNKTNAEYLWCVNALLLV